MDTLRSIFFFFVGNVSDDGEGSMSKELDGKIDTI